ncbi:bifunctional tetrahydrofolate synthase/dihydrofolate synthase [Aliiglaciecola sp.]|nr:bifunctional tetrahydrofolate synthase/dihydrofolate synthase [Aliiglaciecola sp.]
MPHTQSPHDQGKPSLSWSLPRWLDYLLAIHTKSIDMGLARTQQVFERLSIDFATSTVITVAGTNGKGTTCRFIEKSLLSLGHSVGVYSSPHITDYNERVRINDKMLSDEQHLEAFMAIEQARGDIPLTYFEFATLSAMLLISQHKSDYVLMEVGLGGRLDAVNILTPDMAVITSIGLDHQDWLGNTRELIAIEKAGIMRPDIPVVIGELDVPASLTQEVARFHAKASWQGQNFCFIDEGHCWKWISNQQSFTDLPMPQIPMQNVSTGLEVLLRLGLELTEPLVKQVIEQTSLPGRFEVLQQRPYVIADVAHNPQATQYLFERIQAMDYNKLHFVVAMLADKDIAASLTPLLELDASWYLASLEVERGAQAKKLKSHFHGHKKVIDFNDVADALKSALSEASEQDLIIVFGSFFTVSHAKKVLNLQD